MARGTGRADAPRRGGERTGLGRVGNRDLGGGGSPLAAYIYRVALTRVAMVVSRW
jgi:hypothetical protein